MNSTQNNPFICPTSFCIYHLPPFPPPNRYVHRHMHKHTDKEECGCVGRVQVPHSRDHTSTLFLWKKQKE